MYLGTLCGLITKMPEPLAGLFDLLCKTTLAFVRVRLAWCPYPKKSPVQLALINALHGFLHRSQAINRSGNNCHFASEGVKVTLGADGCNNYTSIE